MKKKSSEPHKNLCIQTTDDFHSSKWVQYWKYPPVGQQNLEFFFHETIKKYLNNLINLGLYFKLTSNTVTVLYF